MVQGIMENGLLSLIMLGGMDLPSIPAHTYWYAPEPESWSKAL